MSLGLETYLGCERKEWGKERNRKTNKQVVAGIDHYCLAWARRWAGVVGGC